jgi:hypothetical protein
MGTISPETGRFGRAVKDSWCSEKAQISAKMLNKPTQPCNVGTSTGHLPPPPPPPNLQRRRDWSVWLVPFSALFFVSSREFAGGRGSPSSFVGLSDDRRRHHFGTSGNATGESSDDTTSARPRPLKTLMSGTHTQGCFVLHGRPTLRSCPVRLSP